MDGRFEHLEHIDDDLSWGGLQAAATEALKPSRCRKCELRRLEFNGESIHLIGRGEGTMGKHMQLLDC